MKNSKPSAPPPGRGAGAIEASVLGEADLQGAA
jgi:hypothetical protein